VIDYCVIGIAPTKPAAVAWIVGEGESPRIGAALISTIDPTAVRNLLAPFRPLDSSALIRFCALGGATPHTDKDVTAAQRAALRVAESLGFPVQVIRRDAWMAARKKSTDAVFKIRVQDLFAARGPSMARRTALEAALWIAHYGLDAGIVRPR